MVCLCWWLRAQKKAKPILHFGHLGGRKVLYRGHVGGRLFFPCPQTNQLPTPVPQELAELLKAASDTSCTELWHIQNPPCTYRVGIRKYYTFCTQLVQASHQSLCSLSHQTLQANTIQVYLAAVTHLHPTRGFNSPAPPPTQETASHHGDAGATTEATRQ